MSGTTASPRILTLPLPLAPDALAGKVVLLTGAGRGLGRAVALAAAAHGASLVLLGRDPRALEKLADELEAAGGASPVLLPLNLEGATVDDHAHVAELLAARFSALDGLVFNAAMLGEIGQLEHYDPLQWARVFQVNVHSTFLLLRACMPLLRRARSASIVFISSSVGRRGRAYWGAYAASKFALEGLMQTLADELRDTSAIRVNSLNPGRLRTRMRAQAYPAENPASLPEPALAAPYVVHLLSEANDCHGETLELPSLSD